MTGLSPNGSSLIQWPMAWGLPFPSLYGLDSFAQGPSGYKSRHGHEALAVSFDGVTNWAAA